MFARWKIHGKAWDILPYSGTFHTTEVTLKLRLRKTLMALRLAECVNVDVSTEVSSSNTWAGQDYVSEGSALGRRCHLKTKQINFSLVPMSYGSANRLWIKEKDLYWVREKHGDITSPKPYFHFPRQSDKLFSDSWCIQIKMWRKILIAKFSWNLKKKKRKEYI